jgi:superfamily II DNA or RNA helicase
MIAKLTNCRNFFKIEEISQIELSQLELILTKEIQNKRFNPLVKKKLWDGKISYLKNNYFPSGLWETVYTSMKKFGYEVKLINLKELFAEIDDTDFRNWITDHFKNKDKKPYEYQIDNAIKILKFRRNISELTTSAGKSLILYICAAYLIQKNIVKKWCIIVPNISLVTQLIEDFGTYNDGMISLKYEEVFGGAKPKEISNIVVGTYQSLVKKDPTFFDDFDGVIIDEAHSTNCNSIKKILEKFKSVDYRIGVSGTFPKENTLERLTISAYIGPMINLVNADYLIKNKYITSVDINILLLNYVTDEVKNSFKDISLSNNSDDKKNAFLLEKQFVIDSDIRLNFLVRLVDKIATNNTLILFHRVDYGTKIYDALKKFSNKNIMYVSGETHVDIRDLYKKKMESTNKFSIINLDNNIKFKIPQNMNVELSNGEFKKAKDLLIDDDISDNWIKNNL